jgi:hypothetical protein
LGGEREKGKNMGARKKVLLTNRDVGMIVLVVGVQADTIHPITHMAVKFGFIRCMNCGAVCNSTRVRGIVAYYGISVLRTF